MVTCRMIFVNASSNPPNPNAANPETAKTDSKTPKTLAQFRTFAARFGVEAKRILDFTDDSTSDDTHDERVAKGLDAIETEEAKYKKNNLITIEDAKRVTSTVRQDHSVFKSLEAVENAEKTNVQYNWTASSGTHSGARLRRPPYTDDLEPAPDEGTQVNPFPINWPKPASANYPKIYLGGKRKDYKSQADLRALLGQPDDTGTIVQEYSPHDITRLSNNKTIGLSTRWQLDVGTIIGPLKAANIPRVETAQNDFRDSLREYGFRGNRTQDDMQIDHVHELQMGGQDTYRNLWPLDSTTNGSSGRTIDQYVITLRSGKTVKLYQLRELVSKTNRDIYFQVQTTIR
jgi:hypothetical protein